MAVSTSRQRPERPKKGPGPDHTPGAWVMKEDELDRGASSMTFEQARTLRNLAQEGREPDAYNKTLSAEGADVRIRILRAKIANDKSGKQHKPD